MNRAGTDYALNYLTRGHVIAWVPGIQHVHWLLMYQP